MLLSIALFTGIFCAGCGARSDEILLESQEDTSDTVEETEQEEREMTDEIQPLSDGQQVYVPTVQEAEEGSFVPAVPETTGTGESMGTEDGIVNLNTADAETLKTLSGIGDSKAQAILAYREEHGGFSSIEEIMQVPGIKESTFSMIKDKIAVK